MSSVRYKLGSYILEDDILHSYRRENLKSYTELAAWTLQRRCNVFPVRFELGIYIPEDGIHHSRRRENLKSFITLTNFTAYLTWKNKFSLWTLNVQTHYTEQCIIIVGWSSAGWKTSVFARFQIISQREENKGSEFGAGSRKSIVSDLRGWGWWPGRGKVNKKVLYNLQDSPDNNRVHKPRRRIRAWHMTRDRNIIRILGNLTESLFERPS
jgi:hypothetical protein